MCVYVFSYANDSGTSNSLEAVSDAINRSSNFHFRYACPKVGMSFAFFTGCWLFAKGAFARR